MFDNFRYYTEWNEAANRWNFEAPADPWKVIWVDPATVKYYNIVSLKWGMGRVAGGDWDQSENYSRVDKLKVHEGLYQHFEEGLDWEETAYYDWAQDHIEQVGHYRGYEEIEAVIDNRCPEVDEIFEDMRTNGYRPNYEDKYDHPEDAQYIHDLEPFVLIGHKGEILWTEGFHRLILADLAGIDRVPVYVLIRHEGWQGIRDELVSTPPEDRPLELTQFENHPDVRDIQI